MAAELRPLFLRAPEVCLALLFEAVAETLNELGVTHLGAQTGDLAEARALVARAGEKDWVVNVKPPLAGPEHVVRYLSRYTHRIAITNSRITSYDGQTVVFRYKDRKDGKTKIERVSGEKFCRRFLRHVLPPRFVRIRHYGLLASRNSARLARCREILGAPPRESRMTANEPWDQAVKRIFGKDPLLCPRCGKARMVIREIIPPLRL